MKFVIALIRHETNTFSPIPTVLSDFRRGTGEGPAYGEAARLACEGTKNAATAYLDMAREMGAEVDFAVYASAVPSGVVTREAFEHLCDAVVRSASQGCDAVLLDLHGAMVVDGYPDAEGELLRRLRECTPAGLPIGVSLDFHANFSSELIRNATVIAGYCTYPHVDIYETGERVARSIRAKLEGRSDPVLLGECLSGALYAEDFRRIMDRLGCADVRCVSQSPIPLLDPQIEARLERLGIPPTARAEEIGLEDFCALARDFG